MHKWRPMAEMVFIRTKGPNEASGNVQTSFGLISVLFEALALSLEMTVHLILCHIRMPQNGLIAIMVTNKVL